jgi:catechol 2,3-dioxygenase-like lactoylglutathione lyase family enzyme
MIEKLGNVFYRVSDMDAAVTFYAQVLGLPLKFRDGNNWAAFDVAGVTLALEGGAPQGGATVSLRVSDLDQVVATLRQSGARVSEPVDGPHERRAELTDPAGNTLVLYQPR